MSLFKNFNFILLALSFFGSSANLPKLIRSCSVALGLKLIQSVFKSSVFGTNSEFSPNR